MFSEEEKAIFSYDGPSGKVHADPLEVRRKLIQESVGCFYSWLADCQPDPDGSTVEPGRALLRENARASVVAATRAAFGLPAIDAQTGQGVTEWRVWTVLREFQDFFGGPRSSAGA